MKKPFIFYIDMDGVLNLFESDPNARINMWKPGYFKTIPVRPGISDLLVRINSVAYVVILSKIINRINVSEEKNWWCSKNLASNAYSKIIYVPYNESKADYINPNYPSIIVDDKEKNIEECEKKGCHGILLSDLKTSQKYPNAKSPEDLWNFYCKLTENL